MRQERADSIFEDQSHQAVPTEAGISISRFFDSQQRPERLSRTEKQGRGLPAQSETDSPIDPIDMAEELTDLAREAGIRPREIGEE